MKILVATDGTQFGEAAVKKACEIAACLKDAEIEVISVYETPSMTMGGPYAGVPAFYPELVEGAKAVAKGSAAKARSTVTKQCPAVAVNSLVCMGGPAEMILEAAKEWGGRSDRGRFARLWLLGQDILRVGFGYGCTACPVFSTGRQVT